MARSESPSKKNKVFVNIESNNSKKNPGQNEKVKPRRIMNSISELGGDIMLHKVDGDSNLFAGFEGPQHLEYMRLWGFP